MNSKDIRNLMYFILGSLLVCLIIVDFSFSNYLLVQKYVPNLVAEIIGIFIVVAFIDQLLTTERKSESERFQQFERIRTAGLNIRSIPDVNEGLLKAEYEKLWEIGGLGDQEYREAAMSELNLISIFAFDDKNKVTLLMEAIENQFLELVGPEHIPFEEKWKEDLVLKGLEIIEFTCCLTSYIFQKSFFTRVQETIQYFFDVAIQYQKKKIASKCFQMMENIENGIKEKRDESEFSNKEWEEGLLFLTNQFSNMKNTMRLKIEQNGYEWNLE